MIAHQGVRGSVVSSESTKMTGVGRKSASKALAVFCRAATQSAPPAPGSPNAPATWLATKERGQKDDESRRALHARIESKAVATAAAAKDDAIRASYSHAAKAVHIRGTPKIRLREGFGGAPHCARRASQSRFRQARTPAGWGVPGGLSASRGRRTLPSTVTRQRRSRVIHSGASARPPTPMSAGRSLWARRERKAPLWITHGPGYRARDGAYARPPPPLPPQRRRGEEGPVLTRSAASQKAFVAATIALLKANFLPRDKKR
jgi:hypothetical protein